MADIFVKATGQILENRNTAKYLTPDHTADLPEYVTRLTYSPNRATVLSALAIYRKADETTKVASVMSDAEKVIVNNEVVRKDAERSRRIVAVESKSATLRAAGYEYPAASGNMHSLSLAAQIKLEQIRRIAVYPHTVSTLDETSYVIPDATDADAMQLAQMTRAEIDIHQKGAVLKNSLKAATTRQEIDDVLDDRT